MLNSTSKKILLPLKINNKRYFVGGVKHSLSSLTLIVAVDVSHSSHASIQTVAKILGSFLNSFKDKNDRIGLISIQDNQARILNHPTHNYRTVIKNLKALKVEGQSPLADGLEKALFMYQTEKRKRPASNVITILISDCFPEPINNLNDLNNEPAFLNTLNAGRIFKQNKIPLLIIRPRYYIEGNDKAVYLGDILGNKLSEVSNGQIVVIDAILGNKQFFGNKSSDFDKDNMFKIEEGLSNILKNFGQMKYE